jgi:type II secretory pathway pseudopilin PulG
MIYASMDWATIGTFFFGAVTAAASVALAAASRASAQAARDSVKALAASVAAMQEQTRQGRLPRLTPAESAKVLVSPTNDGTTCRLKLRNDGYGPAVIVLPSATDGGIQMPDQVGWQRGSVSAHIVPPGGEVELTGNDPSQPDFGRFYLRVAYTDVLGDQRATTYIHIAIRNGVWDVTGTAHKPEDGGLQKWGEGWDTDWLAREGLA